MEVVLRKEIHALYAGNPEGLREALDDLDDVLGGDSNVVGLNDPRRDDAWAAQAGD